MNLPEKKAAVFRAVLKLLRQGRPLGDLKVSEIAEAAGIGKGTVYEYFPSREELLRDAMQEGHRDHRPPAAGVQLRFLFTGALHGVSAGRPV